MRLILLFYFRGTRGTTLIWQICRLSIVYQETPHRGQQVALVRECVRELPFIVTYKKNIHIIFSDEQSSQFGECIRSQSALHRQWDLGTKSFWSCLGCNEMAFNEFIFLFQRKELFYTVIKELRLLSEPISDEEFKRGQNILNSQIQLNLERQADRLEEQVKNVIMDN